MLSRILYLTFSFYISFSCIGFVHAFDAIPSKITIVVPEIRPLIFVDENRRQHGQLKQMFEQFTKKSGIEVQLEVLPWGRALKLIGTGVVDAIMPAQKTDERQRFLTYPDSPLIFFAGNVILKNKHENETVKSWADINNSSIGQIHSMDLGSEVEELFENKRNKRVNIVRLIDGLNMLKFNRVDYVVMDALIAITLINDLNLTDTIQVIPYDRKQEFSPSYLAFSKDFAKQYDVNQIMEMINQVNDPKSYIKKLRVLTK